MFEIMNSSTLGCSSRAVPCNLIRATGGFKMRKKERKKERGRENMHENRQCCEREMCLSRLYLSVSSRVADLVYEVC